MGLPPTILSLILCFFLCGGTALPLANITAFIGCVNALGANYTFSNNDGGFNLYHTNINPTTNSSYWPDVDVFYCAMSYLYNYTVTITADDELGMIESPDTTNMTYADAQAIDLVEQQDYVPTSSSSFPTESKHLKRSYTTLDYYGFQKH